MSEETVDAVVVAREPYSTLKQKRLAVRLADPNVDSYTEAMVGSGYAETTAAKSAKAIRESIGVQRAIKLVEAEQRSNRDKARGVTSKALDLASENMEGETDPLRLMQIAGAGAMVFEKTPEEETAPAASLSIAWYRRWRRRSISRAVKLLIPYLPEDVRQAALQHVQAFDDDTDERFPARLAALPPGDPKQTLEAYGVSR